MYRHLKVSAYAELLDYVLQDRHRFRSFLNAHVKLLSWFRDYNPEWDTAHSPVVGRRDAEQVQTLHLMKLYHEQYSRRPFLPRVAYRTELMSRPLDVGDTIRWKHPTGKKVSSWSEVGSPASAHTDVKLEDYTEDELRRRRLYEVFFKCRPSADQIVWTTSGCAPVVADAHEFVLVDYPQRLDERDPNIDQKLADLADLSDQGLGMVTRMFKASSGKVYDEREIVLVTDRSPIQATVVSVRKLS